MIVATPVTPREGAGALQSCSLPILHIYFTPCFRPNFKHRLGITDHQNSQEP